MFVLQWLGLAPSPGAAKGKRERGSWLRDAMDQVRSQPHAQRSYAVQQGPGATSRLPGWQNGSWLAVLVVADCALPCVSASVSCVRGPQHGYCVPRAWPPLFLGVSLALVCGIQGCQGVGALLPWQLLGAAAAAPEWRLCPWPCGW
ncbi:hypothetical protein KIL84_005995 [Mauremys mutica]|uniref:Uncharacterized protein n=1 Tax=Mauremys mutica TaxID=74926 RepID=A0A9D3XJ08_9SAUR|nr:hypothetical protein KIL84_005995 [Mauremys mutica]